MGLYLCVFAGDDGDEELDGVEAGGYDDFGELRDLIASRLEYGAWGSRFPVLMNHPDSQGEWAPAEASQLQRELTVIRAELTAIPAPAYPDGWQAKVARQAGHEPSHYGTYFIDVDGELLLDRLIGLAELATQAGRPITFM
jgi:hypothetical protein